MHFYSQYKGNQHLMKVCFDYSQVRSRVHFQNTVQPQTAQITKCVVDGCKAFDIKK